jgi:hypothetical protein
MDLAEILVGTPAGTWTIIEIIDEVKSPMQINLELPDDVAKVLESQVKNLPRALREFRA